MSQGAMNGLGGPLHAPSPATSTGFYAPPPPGPHPYSNQPYQAQLAHHQQQYPYPISQPLPVQQTQPGPPSQQGAYGHPPPRPRAAPPLAPPPPQAQHQANGHAEQPKAQPAVPTNADGWEGGSMLDLYIADYLAKRGYHQAAQQVIHEAGLGKDSKVPIDAPQGLLYEWWSVFWELFTATGGPDQSRNAVVPHSMDAALYVQAQAQAQAQNASHPNPPSQSAPAGYRPPPPNPSAPPRTNSAPFAPAMHPSQQPQEAPLGYSPHPNVKQQQQAGPRPGQPPVPPQYHTDGRPVPPGGYLQQHPPQIQMQSPSPNGLAPGQMGSASAGPPPESYGYHIDQSQSQQHLPPNHPSQIAVSQPRPQPPQPNQMQLQQQAHLPPGAGQQQPILHPFDALGLPGPLEQNVVMGLLSQLGLAGRDLTRLTSEEKSQVQLRYPQFLAQHHHNQQSGQTMRIASQNRPRPPPQNGMTAVQAQQMQAEQQMSLARQHQMQNHHMPVKMEAHPQKRSNSPPDGENGGPTGKRARKSPPNGGPLQHQQMMQSQQQQRPMYLAPTTNSPLPQSPAQYGQMGDPQQQFMYSDQQSRDGRQSPAMSQMTNGGGPMGGGNGRPMLRAKPSKADVRLNGSIPPPQSAPSPLSQVGTPNPSMMPPPTTPGPSANGQRTNPQTPKDAPPASPANSVGANAVSRARPPTPLANSMVASPQQYSQLQQPFGPGSGQPPINGASPSAYSLPQSNSNSNSRTHTPANVAPSPSYVQSLAPSALQQQQQRDTSTPAHSPAAGTKPGQLAPPPTIVTTTNGAASSNGGGDSMMDLDAFALGGTDWASTAGMMLPFDDDGGGEDLSGFDFEQYMNLAGDGLVGGED